MTDTVAARVTRDFAAGSVLFHEGDRGAEMFVIQRGLVQIRKSVGGEDRPLATLGKGEFVGEMAILNGKPRSATAVVIEDTRCLVIDADTLKAMITQSPEIALRLLTKLARRLDSADELIKILLNPDPETRVLMVLKRHIETDGEDSELGVRIPVTPDELAAEIALDPSALEEVLARLRRARIVADPHRVTGANEVSGRGSLVVVADVERLDEFLEFLEMPRMFEAR